MNDNYKRYEPKSTHSQNTYKGKTSKLRAIIYTQAPKSVVSIKESVKVKWRKAS